MFILDGNITPAHAWRRLALQNELVMATVLCSVYIFRALNNIG